MDEDADSIIHADSVLACLQIHLKKKKPVAIYYANSNKSHTKRSITPNRIYKTDDEIYVDAFCHLRNARRIFRADRIKIDGLNSGAEGSSFQGTNQKKENEGMETKQQKNNTEPNADKGFVKALCSYYAEFLETDFKKERLPKRRSEYKNKLGNLIGVPLKDFSNIQNDIWGAMSDTFFDDYVIPLHRKEYTQDIPKQARATIAHQIESIDEEKCLSVSEETLRHAQKYLTDLSEDPEVFLEKLRAVVEEQLVSDIIIPLLNNLTTHFENLHLRALENLVALEEELASFLLSNFESELSEAAVNLQFEKNDKFQEFLSSLFSHTTLKGSLTKYFDSFKSADLLDKVIELENSLRVTENSGYYANCVELVYQNNKFPLFYLPMIIERDKSNVYVLDFEPHLYINKKAVDFIGHSLQAQDNSKVAYQSPITDRLIYLKESDLPANIMQDVLIKVCASYNMDSQLDLTRQEKQEFKFPTLKINNNIDIAIFDKADEAILNDYEAILNSIKLNDNIFSGFIDFLEGTLHQNPISIDKKIADEWDETSIPERLVFDSPIPLAEEQRKILSACKDKDSKFISVEGPPGTGKSHTITAIAFEAILSNKSVLVLSDKKEALDVVQDKLNQVINKVRVDEDFQNPILRLGLQGSNYANLLKKKTLQKIETHLGASKAKNKRIGPQITEEKNSLKNNIRRTISVQSEISYKNIQEFHEREKHFTDSHGELYDLLENDEQLKAFILKALSIRDNLKGVSKVLKGFVKERGGIGNEIIKILKLAEITQTLPKSKRLIKTLTGEQVPTLLEITRRIEDARIFLFGYLFSGKELKNISRHIMDTFGVRVESPQNEHNNLCEIHTYAISLKEALDKQGFTDSEFSAAYSLSFYGGEFPSSKIISTMFDELDKKLVKDFSSLSGLQGKEEYIPLLNTTLCDLILKSSDELIEALFAYSYLEKEKKQFEESFNKFPKYDYLGKKTKIESLNTQKLTTQIDERLVNFERENRADAKALKDIIKRKGKFPLDKFNILKNAFPCIIAGLRDYAEFIPLEKEIFDLVIIDEASQVSIAQAFPALIRAKKLVVLGDTNQFGNVKTSNASKQLNGAKFNTVMQEFEACHKHIDAAVRVKLKGFNIKTSILDFANNITNFKIMLVKHFRSYAEMISFSSKYFYGNQLQPMKLRGVPIKDVFEFCEIDTQGKVDKTLNTNADEVAEIIGRLEVLIKDGSKFSVGIITPFRQQQSLFNKTIKENSSSTEFYEKLRLKVMTFDSCQGEERDIIFYSFVACTQKDNLNYIFPKDIDVVDDDEIDGSLKRQRLNVGFSRGKEKLIFVHSKPINQFKSSLKTVLMHYEQRMVEGPSAKDTDQKSPMEAKVLDWLTRTAIKNEFGERMEIIPQFPLGEFLKKIDPSYNHPAYKVDFLLRIKDKENTHHIIIEYDGFEHHFDNSRSSEIHEFNWENHLNESDIEREKVMESYGYRMLRINRFNVGQSNPIAELNRRINILLEEMLSDGEHELLESIKRSSEEALSGIRDKTHKICSKCGIPKPMSSFADRKTKSGYRRTCYSCKRT
jgi:very-short-patch-repair endonuclease